MTDEEATADALAESGDGGETSIDSDDRADEATSPEPVHTPEPDATRTPPRWRRFVRWGLYALAALLLLLVVGAVVPVSSSNLDAEPGPVQDYDRAVDRIEQLRADEIVNGVIEKCESRRLLHGEPTERVVVLFHGLTNCPQQFEAFAEELHAEGANVIVLRAPRHGLGDENGRIEDVSVVGGLSAQELRDFADESIDIANGLGDRIEVLGLSMGGVLSLWTAEFRDDVDRVVAVAPAISIPGVPHFLTTGFINLGNRLPNFSLPTSGVQLDHTYAGESTGALAGMFLLARATENEIPSGRSAADSVAVVLNPDDDQVDNAEVTQLVERWSDADGPVDIVVLDTDGLPHDLIDPDQPAGDVDQVYPVLHELLTAE